MFLYRIVFVFLLLKGILMSATITNMNIDGTKVPIIYEKSKLIPAVSLQIIFKGSGCINDNQKAGLANLSALILNEGTKKAGSIKFAEELEMNAIDLSINSGRETLVISLESLKERLNKAKELLIRLLKDPNLTEQTLQKVKTKVLGQLKRKENDYDYIANLNLIQEIFKNTPISTPSLGTQESINHISLKDIKNFLNEKLILENVIFLIGGDLSKQEAKDIAKDILKNLHHGKNLDIGFYNVSKDKKEKIISKKQTEQAYIYFGSPFYLKTSDEDAYKAKVAAFILGDGGFGSRLMEEIRVKRGLAYSAYARVYLNLSNSYFKGHLQTKLQSQNEAIKVVKEEIKRFVEKGVTQKELDGAKKFLLGSEPLRVETLSQRLYRSFNEFYTGKKPGFYKEQLKQIESLSLEELNSFIKKHKEIMDLTFSIVTK
jgi:predicted Zn-dependent peptidase